MSERYVDLKKEREKIFLFDIPNGDHESVKKFLGKYPTKKTLYNEKKESVAAIALKWGQIEIYETLLARGFCLGISEDVDAVTQNLDFATKEKLREINKKYLIDPKLDHLTSLLSKCKLSHDALESEHKKFFGIIAKILIVLNEIEEIEPILRVISCSDQLKIVFDFYQKSVQHMVPAAGSNTNGICFHVDDFIYVAAENVERDPHETLGVLAHEMCHYAMSLVYNNNCKPYKKDSEAIKIFEKISVICESKKELEPCIEIVFDDQYDTFNVQLYKTSKRHCELIVRVPHLMAMYKDTEKLEDLKVEFRELFEFYEVEVLNDLEEHYKFMISRNQVSKINDLSGLSTLLMKSKLRLRADEMNFLHDESQFSIISSSCVQLTMVAICNKLCSDENFDSKFLFLKADALLNDKMFSLVSKAFETFSKPAMIIDGELIKVENLDEVIKKLQANQMNQRVLIVIRDDLPTDQFAANVSKFIVKHCWSQLSEGAKEEALGLQVALQGKLVPLKNLFQIVDVVDEIPLRELFEGMIEIGSNLEFDDIKFHLNRKFSYLGRQYEGESILNALNIILRVMLLSENPGMGKTTEFKMMSLQLKEKYPSSWVVFVDFKEFVSTYQRDGKVTQKFENEERITKYFCDEILKIKGFEAEVFRQLFKTNRVVFLLDGFDEISPSFKEFNLSLILAIKKESKNQLWISTRPHLEQELSDLLQRGDNLNLKVRLLQSNIAGRKKLPINVTVHVLRLVPLTRLEKEEFLRRKLESKSTDSVKIEEKLQELMQVINKLEESTSDSSPLLLQLVSEICADDSKFSLTEANFYSIYESFTQKVMKNYFAKGSEAKRDAAKFFIDSTDIMSIFYQKAFEVVFGEEHEVLKLFGDAPKLSIEQMARIGFISFNSKLEMEFVHRTFAEFFVSDCLIKKLFLPSTKPVEQQKVMMLLLPALKMILVTSDYPMLRTFIDGAIKTSSIVQTSEETKIIMREVFKKSDMCSALFRAVLNGHSTISKVIRFALPVKYLNRDHRRDRYPSSFISQCSKIIFMRKNRERLREYQYARLIRLYSETFLHTLQSLPIERIEEVVSLAKEIFYEKDFKLMFDN